MPWKKPVAMGSEHIIANIKVVNLLLQVERAMPTECPVLRKLRGSYITVNLYVLSITSS